MQQQARDRRQRANSKLLRSLSMKTLFSEEHRDQARREKLRHEQDTVAKWWGKLLF
jgi:hypothetical protein